VINACTRVGRRVDFPVYRSARSNKKPDRAFVAAVDDAKLHQGSFEQLARTGELLPLADAALCRSESDWLIGINGHAP